MQSFFQLWQVNLIGYYIFIVLFYQFYKFAVRHAKNDGAATILLQFIGGTSILLLMPLFAVKFPSDWKVYVMLAAACIFYGLSDRMNTTARKHLEVSMFTIISQLSSVFLIIIGLVVFRETFVITKIIGAGFILFANALLVYKRGQLKLNKHTWLAITAAAIFSIAMSIDIGISKQFNLPFYIMFTLVVPATMIFLTEKIPFQDIVAEAKSENRKFYLITGLAWGLFIFFMLRAYQFGKMTTIVPLQAVQVLLNVGIAYFLLKEKDNQLKKILAAFLIILGAYLTVR